MSISYKKVNNMIDEVVQSFEDLDSTHSKVLRETCEKIYMMEAVSMEANNHVVRELKGEITRAAAKLKE